MQGTQYAPRESILCMEHFVALQTVSSMRGSGKFSQRGSNFFLFFFFLFFFFFYLFFFFLVDELLLLVSANQILDWIVE